MSSNYKFFKHESCEYFPCHKTQNTSDFNCLFCFCPLYFLEDCGGNNKESNGIKDCSNCLIPHSKNGYKYIVNKIREINKDKRLSK
ncbi:cysteine-rich small domain-containing protein [Clostridium felsineum]|uniref:Uncharacterized protein n=1 Tax=Clostridium felsineum TaxID=36839 RepID=A0A1S8LBR1_9CLOT|nr:cysteine-rich small domain-containing protein [Clostridium felsineum]MCR3761644.1 cysteine-rich small domain-containing protein [Clostridium felsineum]URZ00021.1 hypothetical protein CLAUR_000040 [Clostridium felsineum]URZ07334.1 hypothetical protein CLROS_026720 [Clostridium felsineum]URZ12365.1 hypothetical protein CROST_030870 [Clostridium felsineum]URZ17027.1 hypothetical protein CLFE_030790 [Clostridium felsineum DSM 794]